MSNNSNTKQAFWLAIGQLANFASAFIGAAILSRYFDKFEYGTYKQILYVYMTMQALFTAGLPSVFAYFIPRMGQGEQKTLVNSVTRLFLYLGIAFSVVLFSLSDIIANLLDNQELAVGLKIFSIFPLFTLPTLGVEGIYTALRKTKSIAVYHVITKTLMLLLTVAPVLLLKTDYKGAIIGWGIASFLTFLIAIYFKNKPYVKIEKELIPNLYKLVFSYSLPLMGAFIAGFFISAADQFFISRYFGTEAFAEYSNGAFSIPIIALISGPVKSVLLPLFSKAEANNNIGEAVKIYNNAVIKSATIIFPVLMFVMFFAKELMIFIYGSQYEGSAVYLRYYMIFDFLQVFPYLSVLLGLGLSSIYLYVHIGLAIFIWIFDYLAVSMGYEAYHLILVRSFAYLLMYTFIFVYIYKKSGINLISRSLTFNTMKILIHTTLTASVVFIVSSYFLTNWQLLFNLMVSAIMFFVITIYTGKIIGVKYIESIYMLKRK